MNLLLTEINDQGCATLRLNNPDRHNAFDDRLIDELTSELQKLGEDHRVRVVSLCANGRSFSAGADLNWMRRMADYSEKENLQDALALAELMKALNELPKPTIALVQGATFGGGVGLVAACDIAIASSQARFCLSEVKLGLIPATIAPYVLAAIGERAARRYFLTAETFSAEEALRIGLLHQVVAPDQLQQAGEQIVRQLRHNGPQALTEAKRLIRDVVNLPITAELQKVTAERIATIRATDEGREGLSAYLQKRKPGWSEDLEDV